MFHKIHAPAGGSSADESAHTLSVSTTAGVNQATVCPLRYDPPFMPPFKRELEPEHRSRLMVWLEELLPGEPVDMVEWVGTDLRQPLHAVVIRLLSGKRPPIVLVHKVEEIERHHMVELLDWSDKR